MISIEGYSFDTSPSLLTIRDSLGNGLCCPSSPDIRKAERNGEITSIDAIYTLLKNVIVQLRSRSIHTDEDIRFYTVIDGAIEAIELTCGVETGASA